MSSILVNTTDFYQVAEELAHDFNLNCAETEADFLTAECFFDEVRDINNEQIESVKDYLNWFDCFAITEKVWNWCETKDHTVITSNIDRVFDAIGKYEDVIISQDNGKIIFKMIDRDGSNTITVQPLKHDKRHIDDIRTAYYRSVKRHGSGAKWIKYFRFVADFYTDAHE